LGAPIDVLWFRVARRADDPDQAFGRIDNGKMMIMLNRGDYWQCAFVIRKGGFDAIKQSGLPEFRRRVVELAPFLEARASAIPSWDAVKLLTVRVDRLREWARPGLLCIGDAAHAMSPVGGVGINLAIQDAVAAANILVEPLRRGPVPLATLRRVQRRRKFPTRVTQAAQVFVHTHVLTRILGRAKALRVPRLVALAGALPWLRRVPALAIGIGVRPEHPRSDLFAARRQ
jgi:2-polyprenyl-6-methoxyphenol hydroxylase-like FAD-dependent oxidoreductase